MIQAIKEIGQQVAGNKLTRDVFLNNVTLNVPEEIKVDKWSEPIIQHVVILKFDLKNKIIRIEIEAVKSGDRDSGREYLWIGNKIRHRLYCQVTTQKLDQILTSTLPELHKKSPKPVKTQLKEVIISFFEKEGKEYRIKPDRFEFFERQKKELSIKANESLKLLRDQNSTSKKNIEGLNQFKKSYKRFTGRSIKSKENNEAVKEAIEICERIINDTSEFLKEAYNSDIELLIKEVITSMNFKYSRDKASKSNSISFYTIQIDEMLICKTEEYKNMVYDEKIIKLFKKSKQYKVDSICSVCGENHKETTSDSTNLKFKLYIIDKIGFSSNLSGDFKRNYSICKDCYQHLMIAETYIRSKLSSKIGKDLNFYILPQFIYKTNDLNFIKFSEDIKSKTSAVSNLRSVKEFQRSIEKIKEKKASNNNFVLNYLFYSGSGQEFKIRKLIKDVPPSRLDFITEKRDELSTIISDKYNGLRALEIGLNQIWQCIPVRVNKKGETESGYLRYLDVIDAIFSNERLDYDFLISQFIKAIEIIYFKSVGYNVWSKEYKTDKFFTRKILQMNFMLLYFKEIGCLGGLNMAETKNINLDKIWETIPKSILDYWNDINIYKDDSKKGLFLLGYLIGEVGRAQARRGIDKKPILNKITFQGMSKEKVQYVANSVFEKLKQYNILKYNECCHSACKRLVDKNIDEWKLSDQENVFYILSGYAFSMNFGYQRYANNLEDKIIQTDEEIKQNKQAGEDTNEVERLLGEAKELWSKREYNQTDELLKKIEESINVEVE